MKNIFEFKNLSLKFVNLFKFPSKFLFKELGGLYNFLSPWFCLSAVILSKAILDPFSISFVTLKFKENITMAADTPFIISKQIGKKKKKN